MTSVIAIQPLTGVGPLKSPPICHWTEYAGPPEVHNYYQCADSSETTILATGLNPSTSLVYSSRQSAPDYRRRITSNCSLAWLGPHDRSLRLATAASRLNRARMPRLNLFRFPAKLRRRVRRNRMATLVFLTALLLLFLLPLYAVWCVYKPPPYLIRYLRHRYPDVLFEVPTAERVIALSIDDAPSAYTDEIMEVLAQNDAHATFFVIGGQVAGREKILRRVVRAGHELGNHAMHDEPSKDLSSEELQSQIHEVQGMLKTAYEAEGKKLSNNYFRPGSGFFSSQMRQLLSEWGFRITLGSVYPHDPQIPYYSVNARHILSMAHPGAIIICHDRRSWTAPMLRVVLPELRKRGYKIVTISDLVTSTTPPAE